ncbi:hypothetical protein GCM10009735_01490 [Actinomadura chokoriensis]
MLDEVEYTHHGTEREVIDRPAPHALRNLDDKGPGAEGHATRTTARVVAEQGQADSHQPRIAPGTVECDL